MTNTWVWDVHIVGLGGIGSWVALFLMHKGVPVIHAYDDDVVEASNLGHQLWRPSDATRRLPKVVALSEYAEREELETKIVPHQVRVTESSWQNFSGIVISGPDSMASRKAIWSHVAFNSDVDLYVDGRIGGEAFQAYTLNPSDPQQVERYMSSLYSDEMADQDPCATRQDFESALALGSHITHNLTLFVQGRPLSEILNGNMAAVAVNGRPSAVVNSLK